MTLRAVTEAEWTGRRSKYGAKRTTVAGITFASKLEADRYRDLALLLAAGAITNLTCQHRFDLYVRSVRIGAYVADFTYFDQAGSFHVEDSKGFRTPLYRWKRKHFEAQTGWRIEEVVG